MISLWVLLGEGRLRIETRQEGKKGWVESSGNRPTSEPFVCEAIFVCETAMIREYILRRASIQLERLKFNVK